MLRFILFTFWNLTDFGNEAECHLEVQNCYLRLSTEILPNCIILTVTQHGGTSIHWYWQFYHKIPCHILTQVMITVVKNSCCIIVFCKEVPTSLFFKTFKTTLEGSLWTDMYTTYSLSIHVKMQRSCMC